MVARQRRQGQVGQRARIDPYHPIDFCARYDRPRDVDRIDSRAYPVIRLIRRSTFEYAERPSAVLRDAAAQLLDELTR